MALHIVEIHPAADADALNNEWFVVENRGDKPFSTRNCTLSVGRRGKRKKTQLGQIDPGFVIGPGEKVRVVTGHPGRKSHGPMPDDDMNNYSLFLGAPVLRGGAGTELILALRSLPLAKAIFDPDATGGVLTSES
ncbi:hypothetical protein [Haliangium sp.]|uniref:hypothetical protein n=1 Tax=Haliangium sp. TaxID=2663208 RepID=UPI003D0BD4CF